QIDTNESTSASANPASPVSARTIIIGLADYMIAHGGKELVRQALLAVPGATTPKPKTPDEIREAANRADPEKLINAMARVCHSFGDNTALHYAAQGDLFDAADLLLKNGGKIHLAKERAWDGQIPAQCA